MESVIVIAGPTASGKTAVSIGLAEEIGGEIISADSMQIYQHMHIGTAKPSKEEQRGIRHYLMDEVSPDQEFSVAKYKELALKYIKEILDKGKIPIVVGGTGLYINTLVYNIEFSETICDWELREQLKNEALENGNDFVYQKLVAVDKEAAAKLHSNDVKRVIRALEVYQHTGKPISYHQELSRLNPPPYQFLIYGLRMERERLYQRIEKRVDQMLQDGLLEEVKHLLEMGYQRESIAMQGLGYKEVIAYLHHEISFEEMVELLKRDTRRFAKRQMTWFKRTEGLEWIDVDEAAVQASIKKIKYSIALHGII